MRNKYLIAWGAAALALGIWLADAAAVPLPAAGGACVLFLLLGGAAVLTGRRGAAWGLCLLFLCAAGAARMGLDQLAWEGMSQRLVGASGTFSAVIASEGETRPGPEGYVRYAAEASSLRYDDGSVHSVRGTVYLYAPWKEGDAVLPPDTAVTVTGKLSPFRFYQNPGKMDLEHRYRSRRLIGRMYTKEPGAIRAEGKAGAYPLEAAALRVRETVRQSFAPYMDPARLTVLMTLLFGGHYEALPEGVLEGFTATGIVHILSVSGSHVALLFGFLCLLGRWLRLSEKVTLPLAALAILAYAALAGFVPPVVRASIMGVLSVAALFFSREREAVLALAAAVFVMLLWDPLYLFDVSFQLSVGASAGIVLFYRPLFALLGRVRLFRWVREGTALALSAQLLTVPVVLYDFHRLPLYFALSNLFVTPLLEWAIIAGLLAALFSFLFLPLAGGLLQGTDYLLWAVLRGNALLASLPHASVSVGAMAPAESALYYGAVFLARTVSWWRANRRRAAGAAALLGGLLLACGVSYARRPLMEFFMPDLGPARAAVLTDGSRTVVWYRDSGLPYDIGERELRSVLEYKGLFHVDLFLGDFRKSRGASPFTLSLPIGEIWLAEGTADEAAAFTAGHPESRVRFFRRARLTLTGGMTAASDGAGWCLVNGDHAWLLDGGGGPMEDVALPTHRLWAGGAESFRQAVNRDTMKWFRPEAALYGGNATEAAGEDRDYFLLSGIPVGDPSLDGMVTLSWDGEAWTMEKYSPSGLTDDFFSIP